MAKIVANCTCCESTNVLAPAAVRLTHRAGSDLSYYAFRCCYCRQDVHKAAPAAVRNMLASAGVTPTRTEVPTEALRAHTGAPITEDDVLGFAFGLEAPARVLFAELMATGSGPAV